MNAFYEQLQRAAEEIEKNVASGMKVGTGRLKEDFDMLADAAGAIGFLSNVARKEGLLALEEAAAYDVDDDFLKRCIMFIVDGNDPDVIENAGLMAIITSGNHGAEKIKDLMSLCGCLMIQKGMNPHGIEETLMSMIPPFLAPSDGKDYPAEDSWRTGRDDGTDAWTPSQVVCQAVISKKESWEKGKTERSREAMEARKSEAEKEKEMFFAAPFPWEQGECGYAAASCLELMLSCMDDRAVQRLLRDTDNSDLEAAMKGLSGGVRRVFTENMSERLAAMLLEDYTFMGPIRATEVTECILKIASVALKLAECGEIHFMKDREDFMKVVRASFDIADGEFHKEKKKKPAGNPAIRKDGESEAIGRLRDALAEHDAKDGKLFS